MLQIIAQHYYPENFRINQIAPMCLEKYDKVRVLTGLPDYETGHVPKKYKFFKNRKETVDGVEINRVSHVARRKGVFFRTLNYFSFAFCGAFRAIVSKKKHVKDIFVYQTSPVLQAVPGMMYKKLTGQRLIVYCLDLWPESLKAWNVKEQSPIFKFMKKVSKRIYGYCDIIAISSRPFKQYLIDVCDIKPERIIYLPQHSDDHYGDIASQYQQNNCVDFLFAGNMGAVQDVDVILKAVSHIPKMKKQYKVHLVGDGSQLESLRDLAKQLDIEDKVIFHGRYPFEKMKEFYSLADCFLLTLRGTDFIGKTLPAKAQDYLGAGKPVVGAINGAGYELIKEADCGEVVRAGDEKGLAIAMQTIIENREKYIQKGRNGRKYYLENFTEEIFKQRLFDILNTKTEE